MSLRSVSETIEATRTAYLHTWLEIQRWAGVLSLLDADVAKLRRRLADAESRLAALERRG